MIAQINGKISKKLDGSLIVDNNGVGYEVFMSNKKIQALPMEEEYVNLYIYTYLKEESLTLYGFSSLLERETFKYLNKVSGIGPKSSIAIISEVDVASLVKSIELEDTAYLSTVPGVGKKTAARIILDLKGKMTHLLDQELGEIDSEIKSTQDTKFNLYNDLTDALLNMGYNKYKISEALKNINISNESNFEVLFKESLKQLSDH